MINLNHLLQPGTFPYVAEFKSRHPDPGQCKVISIHWEEGRVEMSNGVCRYWPTFDEVNIYNDPTKLKQWTEKFDAALALITDEELAEEFDQMAAERPPVICPHGYRFLRENEETMLGDMFYEDTQWILNEYPNFIWDESHGYKMIRKLV